MDEPLEVASRLYYEANDEARKATEKLKAAREVYREELVRAIARRVVYLWRESSDSTEPFSAWWAEVNNPRSQPRISVWNEKELNALSNAYSLVFGSSSPLILEVEHVLRLLGHRPRFYE